MVSSITHRGALEISVPLIFSLIQVKTSTFLKNSSLIYRPCLVMKHVYYASEIDVFCDVSREQISILGSTKYGKYK